MFPRLVDPFHAGDAVVDGDDEVGLAGGGEVDDFRRQAVAQLEAVGNQEIDFGAQGLQGPQADGAGCGAVAVVVGDDEKASLGLDGVASSRAASPAWVRLPGRRALRSWSSSPLSADAAGGVEAGEQRMQALFELPGDGLEWCG